MGQSVSQSVRDGVDNLPRKRGAEENIFSRESEIQKIMLESLAQPSLTLRDIVQHNFEHNNNLQGAEGESKLQNCFREEKFNQFILHRTAVKNSLIKQILVRILTENGQNNQNSRQPKKVIFVNNTHSFDFQKELGHLSDAQLSRLHVLDSLNLYQLTLNLRKAYHMSRVDKSIKYLLVDGADQFCFTTANRGKVLGGRMGKLLKKGQAEIQEGEDGSGEVRESGKGAQRRRTSTWGGEKNKPKMGPKIVRKEFERGVFQEMINFLRGDILSEDVDLENELDQSKKIFSFSTRRFDWRGAGTSLNEISNIESLFDWNLREFIPKSPSPISAKNSEFLGSEEEDQTLREGFGELKGVYKNWGAILMDSERDFKNLVSEGPLPITGSFAVLEDAEVWTSFLGSVYIKDKDRCHLSDSYTYFFDSTELEWISGYRTRVQGSGLGFTQSAVSLGSAQYDLERVLKILDFLRKNEKSAMTVSRSEGQRGGLVFKVVILNKDGFFEVVEEYTSNLAFAVERLIKKRKEEIQERIRNQHRNSSFK